MGGDRRGGDPGENAHPPEFKAIIGPMAALRMRFARYLVYAAVGLAAAAVVQHQARLGGGHFQLEGRVDYSRPGTKAG